MITPERLTWLQEQVDGMCEKLDFPPAKVVLLEEHKTKPPPRPLLHEYAQFMPFRVRRLEPAELRISRQHVRELDDQELRYLLAYGLVNQKNWLIPLKLIWGSAVIGAIVTASNVLSQHIRP